MKIDETKKNYTTKITFLFFTVFFLSFCTTTKDIKRSGYYLKIGSAHLQRGNSPAAILNLLKAVELDSKNAVAHNNLALAYMFREKWSFAKKHLLISLQIDRKYTDARINLSKIHIDLFDYKKAVALLSVAKEDLTYQNPSKVFYYLGISYFYLKKYTKAQKNLKKSVSLNKNNCFATLFYAKNFLKQKQLKKSLVFFKNSLSICKNQQRAEALYYKAFVYFLLNKKTKSKKYIKKLKLSYPNSPLLKKIKKYTNY